MTITLDADGNLHQGKGSPEGGRFTGRTNARPATRLRSHADQLRLGASSAGIPIDDVRPGNTVEVGDNGERRPIRTSGYSFTGSAFAFSREPGAATAIMHLYGRSNAAERQYAANRAADVTETVTIEKTEDPKQLRLRFETTHRIVPIHPAGASEVDQHIRKTAKDAGVESFVGVLEFLQSRGELSDEAYCSITVDDLGRWYDDHVADVIDRIGDELASREA